MKYLVFISLLFSLKVAKANTPCFEFELLGEGLIEEDRFFFVVAGETQSQVKLEIPVIDQPTLVPYIKRWTKTNMILDTKELSYRSKVKKVISASYETPDILNLSSQTSIIRKKDVACPKN